MLLSSHFCQGTGDCEMKTSTFVLQLDMQLVEGSDISLLLYLLQTFSIIMEN